MPSACSQIFKSRIWVLALSIFGFVSLPNLAQPQGGAQDKTERLIVPRGNLGDGAYRAQIIHVSHWHFSRLLEQDNRLTDLCRDRKFNQRYQLFDRAIFALKYTLGVSWITSPTLHDPTAAAEPYKVYYFWKDGGRDGFSDCEVWVQTLDVPETPSPWDRINQPPVQADFLPDVPPPSDASSLPVE